MLEKRPPVVGIFGHIDHGKSTLLDYIRKTNVVEKEAGGITQHISAYEAVGITFLDTPGHEAFSNIRTRGASVADVAVLVVSAEDGVKPQTLEVYKYIKESSLPFIVAITKIDKPNADVERVKQTLAENEIYLEGYGGNVAFVPVSGKTGQGIEDLLELVKLTADLNDLKADREAMGEGVIIENKLDPKRGIVAVGIIKNGTVRAGAFAASSNAVATLRYFLDTEGEMREELSFSSPIQLLGWDRMPQIGSEFKTFLKKEDATAYAEEMQKTRRPDAEVSASSPHESAYLPLIVKADTSGSLEAIESEINKLSRERIVPKVIASGVGEVSESDIKSAAANSLAIVLGFHTKVDKEAKALAERQGVEIKIYDVIYELTDRVKDLLAEREPRIEVEEITGSAKVLKLFGATKTRQVIGARVLQGQITVNASVKILRREAEIGKGYIRELQQAKVKTSSVEEGAEFGALIDSKMEITPGDIIQAVTLTTK